VHYLESLQNTAISTAMVLQLRQYSLRPSCRKLG